MLQVVNAGMDHPGFGYINLMVRVEHAEIDFMRKGSGGILILSLRFPYQVRKVITGMKMLP